MPLPAQPETPSAWREIRAQLRRAVGDSEFEMWLSPLQCKGLDGDVLTLQAPTATAAWVAKRFGATLRSTTQAVVGGAAQVSFEGHELPPARRQSSTAAELRPALATLNPRYSFSQFIIGDSNRLAHAAALSVAELPGQALNPLFLYAPPGLGKTHLLHAIGNYVLGFGDGATVRYTTVEAFTNHFVSAISSRSLEPFKQAYRGADVLLIDDVQFLASKAKTEEEFFHTFNALYDNGRQLVLTCDRLPAQLDGVAERLRERFEAGLVAEIKPPDFATRVAILRKRAALDHVQAVPEDVLRLVAERITDNVRALEGALIRIVAHHSLSGRPIDSELAHAVLGSSPRARSREVSVHHIQEAVATYYDLTVPELVSTSRKARVTWPRHMAIHLARELTETSLQAIGGAFGGRNHATVLHAAKRAAQRLTDSAEAREDLRQLTTLLAHKQDDRTP